METWHLPRLRRGWIFRTRWGTCSPPVWQSLSEEGVAWEATVLPLYFLPRNKSARAYRQRECREPREQNCRCRYGSSNHTTCWTPRGLGTRRTRGCLTRHQKTLGGWSQNHLKSYLRVLKTVTREEAYKGGQKLQTYRRIQEIEAWSSNSPHHAGTVSEEAMAAGNFFFYTVFTTFSILNVSLFLCSFSQCVTYAWNSQKTSNMNWQKLVLKPEPYLMSESSTKSSVHEMEVESSCSSSSGSELSKEDGSSSPSHPVRLPPLALKAPVETPKIHP